MDNFESRNQYNLNHPRGHLQEHHQIMASSSWQQQRFQAYNPVSSLYNNQSFTGNNFKPDNRRNHIPKIIVSGPPKRRKRIIRRMIKERITWWLQHGNHLEEVDDLLAGLCPPNRYPKFVFNLLESKLKAINNKEEDSKLPATEPEQVIKLDEDDDPARDEMATVIKVAISDASGPMPQFKIVRLREKILELINNEEKGNGPRCLGSKTEAGKLLLICSDVATKIWLIEHTKNLVPWEGARLSVHNQQLDKRIGVTWIPHVNLDEFSLLKLLRIQNSGVDFTSWALTNRRFESYGQTVAFSMDNACVEALKNRNFKLFLGFRQIYIRLKPMMK